MKKKKITVMYVWNDLTMGGATQSLLDTLQEIKERINCLVVIREENQIVDYLNDLNIKYFILPFSCDFTPINNYSNEDADLNFLECYEASIKLADIIRKNKIDIVHINSSTSSVGAMAAIIAGVPYIWHIRELLREHFECTFFNIELKKQLFSQAKKIIAISECVKKNYLEQFNINSTRLYNGLKIENYEQLLDHKKFNHKILLAGSITGAKGQWEAVKAIQLLIEQGYSDIELFIVGDGDENLRWRLQKYIQHNNLFDNIHLIPFKKNLTPYREQTSYSITASKMEALGRTTIEAMLAGNIVIGANTGGTLELIGKKGERGYLYKQGDYVELALTLREAMEDNEEKRRKILQKAQQFAKSEFDSIDYSNRLFFIYEQINSEENFGYNFKLIKDLEDKYKELKVQQNNLLDKKFRRLNQDFHKAKLLNLWLTRWLEVRQRGFSISEYLEKQSIQTVAIYGMAQLGCRLYDELETENITIKYVMDKNNKEIEKIIQYVNPEEELPEVDAIIVTVLSSENNLITWLQTKCNYKILGLTHILNDIRELYSL